MNKHLIYLIEGAALLGILSAFAGFTLMIIDNNLIAVAAMLALTYLIGLASRKMLKKTFVNFQSSWMTRGAKK